MKLLFVGTSPAARGTEAHLITLAAAMAKRGHDVEVVAHPDSPTQRALASRGVAVSPGIFRNAADVRGASAVVRAGRRLKAEWVVGSFGHEYWPLLACARALGAKLALFRHLPTKMKPLSRALLPRWSSRFIAVSQWLKAQLVEGGVPEERVRVLYNPLEVERFAVSERQRAQARAALAFSESDVAVGFVGALSEPKGAFALAAALNRAMIAEPALKAIWVGQEQAHHLLRAALDPKLHDRHRLFGWTDDVAAHYAAMDLAAVPSTRFDVFPRVSIEAQASGVPVLGSRLSGIPETLEEGKTGWLVAPGDVDAWSRAIIEAARMGQAARLEMGRRGAERIAQRFSADAIAAEFEVMLRD